MTTKDCVYLGLIILAAVVFYVHGFCAGAEQARKTLSKYLQRQPAPSAAPAPRVATEPPVAAIPTAHRDAVCCARDLAPRPRRGALRIQGDFSNN